MGREVSAVPEEFRSHASEKDWKEIVAWVGDLPPLPHVAAQALNLIEDPDASARKLTELLGRDTALAARVLKIANSAMFARQREITTINQAIMTIGFKTLKGIIVAATLRQLNRKYGQIEHMVWENALCTAVACRLVAYHLRKPYVEELFLLGLLHDLGKLVLLRQLPAEYKAVVDRTTHGVTFIEAELDKFGFGHPLIGALVAKKWNFALGTCQAILHHHDPSFDELDAGLRETTVLVAFCDVIAHSLGHGHLEGYVDVGPSMIVLAESVGIKPDTLEKIREETETIFVQSSGTFN